MLNIVEKSPFRTSKVGKNLWVRCFQVSSGCHVPEIIGIIKIG